MKYSDIAIKVLVAKECGIIKSNAQFWKQFSDRKKFEEFILENTKYNETASKIDKYLNDMDSDEGVICAYDESFPIINKKVKNNSEKPYLLFYKGNLDLLSDLNKNVAVIGVTSPDYEIEKRECEIVSRLTKNDLVIVSGLAQGCDSIAHKACLKNSGKTIAVLPTHIGKIYPAENKILAQEIVKNEGLLISEYYKEATSRFEAVNRFVERDRLQSMFAKAIILIASYRKGEGDSGSRHAMEAARKYEIDRFVMYNNKTDKDNKQFALNRDLLECDSKNKVRILQLNSIEYIKGIVNPNITIEQCFDNGEQIKLL